MHEYLNNFIYFLINFDLKDKTHIHRINSRTLKFSNFTISFSINWKEVINMYQTLQNYNKQILR